MDWKLVPPLSTLRAFEAAARTGSLSAAGRELNVTHAAISQHVRGLEDRLAKSLLVKDGQRLVPTEEGAALAEALSDGFSRIVGGVHALIDSGKARPLRISLTPSFAEAWLMPRLGTFWAEHPDIQVELAPSCDVVDLTRDGFDVAIRYGGGTWPGVDAFPLVFSRYAIVGPPGKYLRIEDGDLSELKNAHWLIEHRWPEGELWLAQRGINPSEVRMTALGTISLAVQGVRAGHGISLVPSTISEREVAAGLMDVLYEDGEIDSGYHVVTKPGGDSPARREFIKWLKKEASAATC